MLLRFLSVSLLLGCAFAAHGAQDPTPIPTELPPVRVRLASLGTPSKVEVSGTRLRAVDTDGSPLEVPGESATLKASAGQVVIGEARLAAVRLDGEALTVEVGATRRDYAGVLIVSAGKRGLTIQNECSLERYAEGVLAGECPALFHPEAIRAMAIAARSYSYRKAFLGTGELCDTVHCQVYRGANGVRSSIRDAVRDTRGKCALFEGEVIDAVYSSDCGGYTEANESAWKGAPVPYLRPVEDAPEPQGEPYCALNRGHRWNVSIPRTRLKTLLGKSITNPTLQVLDFTESGRVSRLRVGAPSADAAPDAAYPKPAGKVFTGDEWRRTLGLSVVKSLKFEVRDTEKGVELEGRGYGHGVGLCQFGANGMGKQGVPAEEILKHYYTGIDVAVAPAVAVAKARFARKRLASTRR
jgi:stage II sporulation protein D